MPLLMSLVRSRSFWYAITFAGVFCLAAGELLAQAPVAPAPSGGSTTIIVSGRTLTFEWAITIAMCGLALFVVCRSSRRN